MRIALATLAAAAALVLSACGPANTTAPAAPVESAKVVGRDYDRGKCTYAPDRRTINGKSVKTTRATCKPDEYEVEVRYPDGDVQEHDVTKAEYDRYTIGANYP